MRTPFADADCWIALLSPKDQHHVGATALAAGLGEVSDVTTQMTLTEAFNAVAGSGEGGRQHVAELLKDPDGDPGVEIIPQTDPQFRAAAQRYASR